MVWLNVAAKLSWEVQKIIGRLFCAMRCRFTLRSGEALF